MPAPDRRHRPGTGINWPNSRATRITPIPSRRTHPEASMNHVYKHLELTGSSPLGSDEAIHNAITKASQSVRNIDWFNVIETRGVIVDGKIAHWQVTLKIGFRLEDGTAV